MGEYWNFGIRKLLFKICFMQYHRFTIRLSWDNQQWVIFPNTKQNVFRPKLSPTSHLPATATSALPLSSSPCFLHHNPSLPHIEMKLCKKQNKIPNTFVLKEHEFKEAWNFFISKTKKKFKLATRKKEKGNNKKRKQRKSVHPFSS